MTCPCLGSKVKEKIGDMENKFKITEYCKFQIKIAYMWVFSVCLLPRTECHSFGLSICKNWSFPYSL